MDRFKKHGSSDELSHSIEADAFFVTHSLLVVTLGLSNRTVATFDEEVLIEGSPCCSELADLNAGRSAIGGVTYGYPYHAFQ